MACPSSAAHCGIASVAWVQSNSITNSSPLAISASAAFASMSGNGQTCVTTSSFLIDIFTPYLICRSSCQSRLTLRSNIHKPGRSPDSENHKYKANPALPGHHCSHNQSITDRATTCNTGTEAHQYTT